MLHGVVELGVDYGIAKAGHICTTMNNTEKTSVSRQHSCLGI
jgi:hypothetical protein